MGAELSPFEDCVQIAGTGWSLPVPALRAAMPRSPGLQTALLSYSQFVLIQVSHAAVVNSAHTILQRLARWLLMTLDRIEGNTIAMTHQLLSMMLGVRRAPVTNTVHLLLAWLTMTRGEDPNIAPSQIRALVRNAAQRPCLMFARTRSMLVQIARLYGPYTRSRKVETQTPRHPRPGDFLDFAADAGGLECFWGSSPVRPGTTAIETRSRNWETRLMLLDGRFRY